MNETDIVARPVVQLEECKADNSQCHMCHKSHEVTDNVLPWKSILVVNVILNRIL